MDYLAPLILTTSRFFAVSFLRVVSRLALDGYSQGFEEQRQQFAASLHDFGGIG